MKRLSLFIMVAAVAMCAAATERFYIEDFTIGAGETRTVSIMLDNEGEYTAFQCDLHFPESLTPSNFAMTDRKHSSHTFSTTTQENGDIRLLCYSLRIKPFTGNEGALVTFDVTASNDFTGPVSITLHNTLFTATSSIEVAFDDEECVVTLASGALIGDVNQDGFITIADVTTLIDYLLGSTVSPFNIDNADVTQDGQIAIGDVTSLIDMLLSGDY
jgi:hypothetical protein